MTLSFLQWVGLFALSIAAALAALWTIGRREQRHEIAQFPDQVQNIGTKLLFEGEMLIDADLQKTTVSLPMIEAVQEWADLRDWLSKSFDALPELLADLPQETELLLRENPGGSGSILSISRRGLHTRLAISGLHSNDKPLRENSVVGDPNAPFSNTPDILEIAPMPIWRTDPQGEVIWQNRACIALWQTAGALPTTTLVEGETDTDGLRPLLALKNKEGPETRWFELRNLDDGDNRLHFATDVTKVIQAENAQRDFIQTLTKTFASLTVGLAIFDKAQRLALFNPALVDLTRMSASQLSTRPDLIEFFDHLRERQVLPEPKNYADWRGQIRDMVTQAKGGLYQEMWTLPAGLTYRVTGRPHPNGAVAFLFEDISAEISLTRRFRTQIELHQSVLDQLDQAIAVISANGLLMFSNNVCTDLLQIDPNTSFADLSLGDFVSVCRDRFGSGPEFSRLEDELLRRKDHRSVNFCLSASRFGQIELTVKPLPGGIRLIIFKPRKHIVKEAAASSFS